MNLNKSDLLKKEQVSKFNIKKRAQNFIELIIQMMLDGNVINK